MNKIRSVVLVAGAALSGTVALGAPPAYEVQRIGLAGGVYWQSNASGPIAYNTMQVTAGGPQGHVGGWSARYSNATQVGQDAWIFDGTSTHVIDITGPAYLEGGFPVPYRSSTVQAINAQGRAIGSIGRHFAGGAVSQGSDAWYWDGSSAQVIGLTGFGYNQAEGSPTTRRSNYAGGMNDNGWVFGGAARYTNGNVTGVDAWLFDGSTTRVIGLDGAGYDYQSAGVVNHWISAAAINNSNVVAGRSDRYTATGTSLGVDAWTLDGSTLTTITLTGGEFETPVSGAGVRRVTVPMFMNDAGQILGTVGRYNGSGGPLGNGVFLRTGASVQIVDPIDTLHSKAYTGTGGGRMRSPTVKALGPGGIVVGLATRFDSAGNSIGEDVWVFDGTTTRIIGLSGPAYQNPPTGPEDLARKNSGFVGMNAAGQIAGWTSLNGGSTFAPSAWMFDVNTGVLTPIVTPPDTGSGEPKAILPGGCVVGQYTVARYPDGTGGYSKAFGWTLADGFFDLGDMLGSGAAAQGWDHLAVANGAAAELPSGPGGGWPAIVYGFGYQNGVVGQTTYLLRPVVTPGTFSLVSPADGVTVGSPRPTLSWTPSAAATSYTVTLSPVGAPTTSFTTASTSAVVPAGMLSYCQQVQWQVVANNLGVQTPSSPSARTMRISSRGDFNQDASTSITDIFDFLSAWFGGLPSADFDHVNGITVADIFNFLEAWFAGC